MQWGSEDDGDEDRRSGGDRRAYARLTSKEIEQIKASILASVYEDIGRSVVKKVLWASGAVLTAVFLWLVHKGYITLG